MALPEYYYEFKRQQQEAINGAKPVVNNVGNEFGEMTGRKYGFFEAYEMDDAEAAIISLGSTSGSVRSIAKKLRAKGEKVGAIKLWMYRPFPTEELFSIIRHLKVLAVMDRAISFGAPYGALCSDISSILQNRDSEVKLLNMIYGLGGRDIPTTTIQQVFEESLHTAKTGEIKQRIKFLDVRE
jgi:pyruvate ferredoxin oxidoreductase alpha subunit